jgi:hypothetical protein
MFTLQISYTSNVLGGSSNEIRLAASDVVTAPMYNTILASKTRHPFFICMAHLREQPPQSQAPTCLRLPKASPCCKVALLLTRSHTQRWVLAIVNLTAFASAVSKRTLHNGINGAALLAQSAVDALCHVDVVTCGPPAAVHALLSLDRDSLRRADGLAELAGNATLFSCRVSSESVFTSEAGRDRALLEGVEDGVPTT